MKSITIQYRKQIIKILISYILIGITVSCQQGSENSIIVNGVIKSYSNKTMVLETLLPNRIDTLLTIKTDKDGNFKFVLDSIPTGFQRIKIDDNNMIYLYLKNNDQITITGDYPNLARTYQITGSDESQVLKEMNYRLIKSTDKLNNLKNQIHEASMIPNFNMDSLIIEINLSAQKLYDSDKEFLTDFITDNSSSPVIYMALYQYIGTTPILTLENDIETFEFVLQKLKKNNPTLPHIALLESVISNYTLRMQQLNRNHINISIGSKAPDFALTDNKGNKRHLSDFIGENVIVAFWSSLNKTSVNNIKTLKEINKNYNFKIILISLDTNKEKWLNAIKSNKIENFTNLCDFKSWESPVAKIYGLNVLPSYVVIDSQFIIQYLTDDIDNLQEKAFKLNNVK
ncbi:MAG: redoxin domain-containing protein [Bacteroidales bacterium]|nr:redoxin domain-containing protein [Bacteroidales bacterium]MDD4216232.1 redoxin domain-containing protein [Bacteroidales bacterium]